MNPSPSSPPPSSPSPSSPPPASTSPAPPGKPTTPSTPAATKPPPSPRPLPARPDRPGSTAARTPGTATPASGPRDPPTTASTAGTPPSWRSTRHAQLPAPPPPTADGPPAATPAGGSTADRADDPRSRRRRTRDGPAGTARARRRPSLSTAASPQPLAAPQQHPLTTAHQQAPPKRSKPQGPRTVHRYGGRKARPALLARLCFRRNNSSVGPHVRAVVAGERSDSLDRGRRVGGDLPSHDRVAVTRQVLEDP